MKPKTKILCLDEETLACFVDRLLIKRERRRVIKHLLKCERCLECVIAAQNLIFPFWFSEGMVK